MVMGESTRGENSRRRKVACHPVSRRPLETTIRQAAREWRLRQAAIRKTAKDLEKLNIQMSTRLQRGKTLTSIQKGQLRVILAGAVHTWREEQLSHGLCPACGYENEDLAHLWWNCKAEQYAHIRERALQHTNVEDMQPAYRDMMLVQKDSQLLNWGKNNTTNEVAAVAAAEELRSKVGSARNRDDGSKTIVGEAAEELGGYLCDGRLQVWTDASCLDPRWEAITRAGAGESSSRKTAS